MWDAQCRTAQNATLLEVVDNLVSGVKSHTGKVTESGFTRNTLDCFCRRGSLFDFPAVTHAVGSYKSLG
jgi:hypothetical protein